MRLLLDTHIFLWFVFDDPALSAAAKALIEDPNTVAFLSVASVWEIAIKNSVGKLPLKQSFSQFVSEQVRRNDITLLPVALPHIVQVAALPYHHRDPFDRMLAAQSLVEQLPLVSVDAVFDNYGVNRLW